MDKKVGIYFDKGGGTRGGPYVRAKLLEKYIPYVEIFNDIEKAKDYQLLDFQWRVPKELEKFPHLCTVHGILPLKYCSNLHAKVAMWYRTQEQKRILKTAKAIIAVSHEASRQLDKLTNNKNIHIVYAGIETDKYKIKKKENKVLFLNSLELYENLQVILDALRYGNWDIDFSFEKIDVYGRGRLQNKHQTQIDKYHLPISIKEEVDNSVIIHELATSKALIQPALQESFGLPQCEAMAS
jgi:hypothetical protein